MAPDAVFNNCWKNEKLINIAEPLFQKGRRRQFIKVGVRRVYFYRMAPGTQTISQHFCVAGHALMNGKGWVGKNYYTHYYVNSRVILPAIKSFLSCFFSCFCTENAAIVKPATNTLNPSVVGWAHCPCGTVKKQ